MCVCLCVYKYVSVCSAGYFCLCVNQNAYPLQLAVNAVPQFVAIEMQILILYTCKVAGNTQVHTHAYLHTGTVSRVIVLTTLKMHIFYSAKIKVSLDEKKEFWEPLIWVTLKKN